MLSATFEFFRYLVFGKLPEPETEETPSVPEEPKPAKLIEHPWPFPSPEPPNVEFLLGELVKGVQTEGDHTFYYWGGQKRRHIRTERGTETILARHMVWWMYGRLHPKTAHGLTTNCGEEKCIKLSHLVLKPQHVVLGPEPRPIPEAVKVPKSEQPPVPPRIPSGAHTKLDRYSKSGREKCMSRKAYFTTESRARQKSREMNAKRGQGSRKFYVYQCDLIGCGGWHLTHINPKKYNKGKKKVGSW